MQIILYAAPHHGHMIILHNQFGMVKMLVFQLMTFIYMEMVSSSIHSIQNAYIEDAMHNNNNLEIPLTNRIEWLNTNFKNAFEPTVQEDLYASRVDKRNLLVYYDYLENLEIDNVSLEISMLACRNISQNL